MVKHDSAPPPLHPDDRYVSIRDMMVVLRLRMERQQLAPVVQAPPPKRYRKPKYDRPFE